MKVNNNFLNNNFINLNLNKETSTSKSNLFMDTLFSVSDSENQYDAMKNQYLNGERDDIQNILIEGQKVNLKISYLLELRNNAVSAVNQLMNISV